MTIQTIICDGTTINSRVYRDIPHDRRGLAAMSEGFLAQAGYNQWGIMTILKGQRRITVARFGKVPA